MNAHCWHKAKDPRCEGFPVPARSKTPALVFFGYFEDETVTDSDKTRIERKMALVCCRCNAISPGARTTRVLWWTRTIQPKGIPLCQPGIKVVNDLMQKEGEKP